MLTCIFLFLLSCLLCRTIYDFLSFLSQTCLTRGVRFIALLITRLIVSGYTSYLRLAREFLCVGLQCCGREDCREIDLT